MFVRVFNVHRDYLHLKCINITKYRARPIFFQLKNSMKVPIFAANINRNTFKMLYFCSAFLYTFSIKNGTIISRIDRLERKCLAIHWFNSTDTLVFKNTARITYFIKTICAHEAFSQTDQAIRLVKELSTCFRGGLANILNR